MEKDVLKRLKVNNREGAVSFLKSLWLEKPSPCPKCGSTLTYFHKKAKKSNCDWKCSGCGEVYKTVSILKDLNER